MIFLDVEAFFAAMIDDLEDFMSFKVRLPM